MSKSYRSKSPSQLNDDDAQLLGEAMEHLAAKIGVDDITMIPPQALEKYARPKRSPVHHLFDWNDTSAAVRYRILQARLFINCVSVRVKVQNEYRETRAFHNVNIAIDKDTVERGYVSVEDVRKSPELVKQVIRKAQSEMNRWRRLYAEYEDVFGPVFSAIDTTNTELNKKAPKKASPKKPLKTARKTTRKKRSR